MTVSNFSYQALPMRVAFGDGAVSHLPDELDRAGHMRALVLCTPGQTRIAQIAVAALGVRSAGVFDAARMHVPVETVSAAIKYASEVDADSCVAIGGGSSIGLGKAIALESGLQIIAVPTTYAGSEMTPIWGLTRNGRKQTGRDSVVLPTSVVYDPQLTTSLTSEISAASGLNAIAHAVEALYAPDASPVISLMAEEGVRALAGALPAIVDNGSDRVARRAALYGAWLCGACLGATTMSLHHKLCHVLGGSLNLPHAQTHAIVLPYVLAYNEVHTPAAKAALQRALGVDYAPSVALREIVTRLPIPGSLSALGVRSEQLQSVIEQVLASPYANPTPVEIEGLRDILHRALRGAAVSE
ncbi:maleylacetate reductase [Gordonia sp. TBRC 11910]|uniref:Maleylacetate reductase n=1 Tax=Gordonia asplenii TaxID=2725283 RepID=A0A848L0Y6_9ACTN|nr:maleylacetate reductase [Gordonia asplenii]NMO04640.1 maleylacetate reductase [Gordonia asplenii]